MTADDGYIKFRSDWQRGPAPAPAVVGLLDAWRRPLYDAGLIGHDDALDVGYGNISARAGSDDCFVISGTQTGHLRDTDGNHYVLVTDYDLDANRVSSVGPVEPSSESLTHAAIYELDAGIQGIAHVHSASLWQSLRGALPTTSSATSYGTPEMAREFGRLYRETDFATLGVAVMGGHENGIVSFGSSLEEATRRLLDLAAG